MKTKILSTWKSDKFLGGLIYQFLIFILLLIGVYFVWHLQFSFFFWDEWDWLKAIVNNNYDIWLPHNEHFLPIIRVFYFLQIKFFNADPMRMHYIMLFIHALTSYTLGFFLWLMFKRNYLALIGTIFFAFHPFQWQNVLWTFQSQIILNLFLFLLALIFIKLYIDKGRKYFYLLSLLFTFLQFYTFGTGLMLNIPIILFYLIFRKKRKLKLVVPYILIFVCNSIIYKIWGSRFVTSSGNLFSLDGIHKSSDYYANATFNNLGRVFTLSSNPIFSVNFIIYTLFLIFIILIIGYGYLKKKNYWKYLLFGATFYLMSFLLMSLSRFNLGLEQSYSDRYAYSYLVPIIFICLFILKFIIENLRRNYKIITISVLVIYSIFFIVAGGYKINNIKSKQQFLFVKNYKEMAIYNSNKSYNPSTFLIHPYLTKDDLDAVANKLNLINSKNSYRSCNLQPIYPLYEDCIYNK